MLLAVYGVLLPGCGGQEKLKIELEDLGPIGIPGELWLCSTDRYPGRLVPALVPALGYTHGRLLRVPDQETMDLIDEFELASGEDDDIYSREEVFLSDGELAWTYYWKDHGNLFSPLLHRSWVRYATEANSRPAFRPEMGTFFPSYDAWQELGV